MKTNEIIFDKVSFSYNTNKLIDNITLKITENGLYLLKGENGKGKTTLIKLLTGIYNDYSGDIFINGQNIKKMDPEEISKLIYIQSQKAPVFTDTLINNVFLGNKIRDIDSKLLNKLILEFEINELLEKDIISDNTVSGGQAQKIGIIRGLLSKKTILIFDEPTANLDRKSIEIFKCYLKELVNKCIVLIITHDDSLKDLKATIIKI